MIKNSKVKLFCRDDISLIENYNEAVADTENVWVCHHRLELTLDGEFANSKADLIRHGMYFKRPYFELIFMKKSDHFSMHRKRKAMSYETHLKSSRHQMGVNNSMHGKIPWNKGLSKFTDERVAKYGKTRSQRSKEK